ncbi:DNA-invertase hin [Ruminiclostridium hungatei]|uniref:DNA-invertase hin n=1 Tax=Ruminiclostridium hungatei TaxID=48256 RepID=A0A1V4SRD8_RUMHU|nr:recombinase family protein [Ruminiclostridium hungatei]OPX46432.1 DNA-invertase hin [Ruminiclostridium hungatei]
MRAAIYTRVSTEEQAREGYSLAAQEKVLRDYCELKNIEVIEVYSDEGISAGTMIKRPDMLRMLSDAREYKFDFILVWKLTRFSRNLKDLLNTCDELERHGVYLQSFSENFDGKTPAGRLMRGVLGLMGQFEREVLSENVILGLTERAYGGARTCSQLLGYDVIKGGSMTVNQTEAEIVKFIFSTYLKYKNLTEVASLCRQKGFRGKRGRKFDAFKIEVILTRFVYAGFYNWHNKPLKGDFEPIISIKTYNKTQQLLKAQGSIVGRNRKHELVFL